MQTLNLETFRLDHCSDGIVTATFDVPGRSMNTITGAVIKDLGELAAWIGASEGIKGLVLVSGKASGFCAGGDIGEMSADTGALPIGDDAIRAEVDRVAGVVKALRQVETCGRPVVAAVSGLALGGGLEMLLAMHRRVCIDDDRIQLGLPEITIGLFPGAGGTQRLPRLIGIDKALAMMLDGKPVSPQRALALGLVDELVAAGQEVEAAKRWIRAGGLGTQPWDRKGFRIPGGGPYENPALTTALAQMRKNTNGNNPAALNLMRCVYEGALVSIDAGLRIESGYFVQTQKTPQAKAMMRSLFSSMQELKKRKLPAVDGERREVRKLAVLGAGMMGAGVAQVCAQAGIEVVLLDRSQADAERGKAGIAASLAKAVEKGRMSQDKADALLARITPTADYARVAGSDFVVEAVFEDRELKAKVTVQAETHLDPDAVFGSNTSGLQITGLAQCSERPENFIGVHFFSPVDRMALVEVIRGERTSAKTLARTIDFVQKIRKTAIVVNDSRGFYTSRTFHCYLEEGFELLAAGVAPTIIDNVGRATGMPRGPLELCDDVGLDLCLSARVQAAKDLGPAFAAGAEDRVLALMVESHNRHGRKNGLGFYNYPTDGASKRVWPGLAQAFPVKLKSPSRDDVVQIRRRLLYRQALEAARILAEGVVTDPRDADVGALLGWGFPSWTGGPLSLIDQIGAAEFVRQCDDLAVRHGERFAVPEALRAMARRSASYYNSATR